MALGLESRAQIMPKYTSYYHLALLSFVFILFDNFLQYCVNLARTVVNPFSNFSVKASLSLQFQ